MNSVYRPPYTLTPAIVNLIAGISETIGRYTVLAEQNLTPRLRRENRIRTIQASLAIENNTLSVEQVTAVIEGKRVLGHPREIQEVRNAFAAYEAMEKWDARAEKDLLTALQDALSEAVEADQVTDQVTDQVAALIRVIGTAELGSNDLMQALGLSHRPTFRNNYLNPALEGGWIERTQPDSPRSPTQRYRLTGKGRRWIT